MKLLSLFFKNWILFGREFLFARRAVAFLQKPFSHALRMKDVETWKDSAYLIVLDIIQTNCTSRYKEFLIFESYKHFFYLFIGLSLKSSIYLVWRIETLGLLNLLHLYVSVFYPVLEAFSSVFVTVFPCFSFRNFFFWICFTRSFCVLMLPWKFSFWPFYNSIV